MKLLSVAIVLSSILGNISFTPSVRRLTVRQPTTYCTNPFTSRSMTEKKDSIATIEIPKPQIPITQENNALEVTAIEQTINNDSTIEIKKNEEISETKRLLQQVKDAGTAGVISYALWELGFWAVSAPVVLFGYYEFTGHLPDLSNNDDITKLSAEAFAFVNFARFAVPLRIGLALSTTPWIQNNIVDKFMKKNDLKDNNNE